MTSPRPWKVVYCDGDVYRIEDAAGDTVVETDCGFYAPRAEDAELIVRAVNLFPLTVEEALERWPVEGAAPDDYEEAG